MPPEDNKADVVPVIEEIEYTKEDGTVIKVVPVSALEAKDAEVAKVSTDLSEARRLLQEKNLNFTRYNELTEEQKKAFNENERNLLMRADTLEGELNQLKKDRDDEKTATQTSTKNGVLKMFHQGVESVKTKLEANYAKLAGMPETTVEEIQERAVEAARLSEIAIDSVNPLVQDFTGEAPRHKDNKDYTETPAGSEALDLVRQRFGVKKA